MGEQRIFIFLKAFIGALFLTFRNLVNFNYSQRQGNDRCLLVCIHALGDNWESPKHCCLLCVLHNSVGSALLVLTVMGIPEPRSVERVTVQFLRYFVYWWLFRGLGYYCYCYEKKVLLVAVRCIGVGLGFL